MLIPLTNLPEIEKLPDSSTKQFKGSIRSPFFTRVFIFYLYSLQIEYMGYDETNPKAGNEDGEEKI